LTDPPPLRALILDEGVLGHRTLAAQLRVTLTADPSVEATFVTVPPPNRLERLLLRRWRRLGDADMVDLRWRLRWSWRARRLLKRHAGSVDVAFVITQASALLMRGPMRRLPCVLLVDATVQQYRALDYSGEGARRSRSHERLLTRLERRAIAGAAAVVAWTEWNAAALRREQEGSEVRIAAIHPGLDAAWWAEAARRRPAEGESPLRVLFVGNEVRRKGLGRLIEAVERLSPGAVLEVVSGDTAPESDAVRVHRGVEAGSEELRDLYAAADVFALPTRADAVPWSVLEAMAAGLPVVASRVGAIEEMIGDAGVTVDRDDTDGLEAALRRLSDPALRRQLGQRGLERVRDSYDNAVQTPRLLALLREVARDPARGGRLRMRRRRFLAIGAGAVGVGLLAPYAVLIADDEFEKLVASRLGIEPELAKQLLARARDEFGGAGYDARAAAFALAVRDPAALVMPDDVRRKAVNGLLEPMLSEPAANLAYAVTGSDPGAAACAGLVRPS
jgi:glycosyltransferase involved in cell wall biosynthesis